MAADTNKKNETQRQPDQQNRQKITDRDPAPLKFPKTLQEAITYFADPDVALRFTTRMRWGTEGPRCPRCYSYEYSFVRTRRLWQCRVCRKQYSVKVGTIFEDSALGLDKWLAGIWLLLSAKNGISSYELSRALGVHQTTAWYMGHRIRWLLNTGSMELDKLRGFIEADETYIGGKLSNMHKDKRVKFPKGRGTVGKAIVMGILERGSEGKLSHVRAKVINDIQRKTLHDQVKANVEAGSRVFTDSLASYQGLDADYIHQWIDHAEKYVDGLIYTNGLENFWSLLKRTIRGTYTHINPEHLFRYLDEQAYRFNTRKEKDGERFIAVMQMLEGKRLMYKDLIETKGELQQS